MGRFSGTKSKIFIILIVVFLVAIISVGTLVSSNHRSSSTNKETDKEIIVAFDPMGGEPIGLDYTEYKVQENGTITKVYSLKSNYGEMPQMYKEGYDFLGWYTIGSDLGIKIENNSNFIEETNHTLYARYAEKQLAYTVVYKDIETDVELVNSENGTAYRGDVITPDVKTVVGYNLVTNSSELSKVISTNNTQITLYYARNVYNIKYTVNIAGVKYTSSYVTSFKYGETTSLQSYESIAESDDAFAIIGYTFKYWRIKNMQIADLAEIATKDLSLLGFSLNFTEEKVDTIELQGVYEINNYTLTFYNGTTKYSEQTLHYNDKVGTIVSPNKDGYLFSGWYTTSTGANGIDILNKEQVDFNEFSMPLENVEVFAGYTLIKYTLTIDLSGGSFVEVYETTTKFTVLDTFIVPRAQKVGYTFNGYRDDDNFTRLNYQISNKTESVNLKAIYTPTQYNINLDVAGGSLSTGTTPIKYTIESDTITLPECSKNGYTFAGWTGEDVLLPMKNVQISTGSYGDKYYVANYNPINYQIEYVLDEGVDDIENPTTYNIETPTFTLNNPTKTGYKFIGWTKNGETFKNANMKVSVGTTGNLTFTTHFEIVQYNIKLNLAGGEIDGNSIISYNINSDDILLPSPTKDGYEFTGWTGENVTEPTKVVKVLKGSYGNKEYTANYKTVDFNITYDLSGGNKQPYAVYLTKYNIELQENYTPSDLTKEGYVFSYWEMYDAGSNKLQGQTIRCGDFGDRHFKAVFAPDTHTLYRVYHYKEKLDGGYELAETQNLYGETDSYVDVNTYTYPGFISPSKQNIKIEAGGTAYVEYYYTRNSYNVSVVTGSYANPITTTSYKFESPVSVSVVMREGYGFNKWTITPSSLTTSDVTNTTISFVMPSRNVELRVVAEVITYEVTIDYNDGVRDDEKLEYNYFSSPLTIASATREGYNFKGYSGTGIQEGEYLQTINIPTGSKGDRTYIANWEIDLYSISYNLNQGTCAVNNPTSYTYETESFILSNPTRNGYTFVGWTGTDLTEKTMTVEIPKHSIGDKEYVANFDANDVNYTTVYRIQELNSDNYVDYDTVQSTGKVDQIITGELIDIEGFTAPSGISITLSYNAENNEIVYDYTRNKYTLTLSKNDVGINQLVGGGLYYFEDTVDISATTMTGYDFSAWSGYISSNNAQVQVQIPASNIQIIASTTPHKYQIEYNLYGGTPSTDLVYEYTIQSNTITINATIIRDGYSFGGWQGTGITGIANSITISKGSTGDRQFNALFTPEQYSISYELNGGTLTGQNPINYNVESASFTLINPTKQGYKFDGWSGTGLTGNDNLEVTVPTGSSGNRSYIANFSPEVYEIDFVYNGATGGNDIESIQVTFDTAFGQLPTPTKVGYTFDGWYSDDEFNNKVTESTIMNYYSESKVVNLYAKYKAKTYTITFDLQNSQNSETLTVEYGSEIVLNIDDKPYYKGYKFLGFYTELGGQGDLWFDSSMIFQFECYNIDSDIVLYANWELGSYTLTLDSCWDNPKLLNATPPIQETTIEYSRAFPAGMIKPELTGYTFEGFFRNKTGGLKYYDENMVSTGRTYNFDENLTLYAHWTPNEYEITLYRNARVGNNLSYLETSNTGTSSVTATYDADMPEADAPYIAGKYFQGYYDTQDNSGNQYYDENMGSVQIWDKAFDTTLYAYYVTHYYTVYLNYNVPVVRDCDIRGTESVSQIVYGYSMPSNSLVAPTRKGYTFKGYFTSGGVMYYSSDMSSVHIWDIDEDDVTLYAKWEINWYDIIYDFNVGYPIIGGDYKDKYTVEDADFTPSHTERIGYAFTHWELRETIDGEPLPVQTIEHDSIGDRYYKAMYTPNLNTPYVVNHYYELLDGSFELDTTENLTGTSDASITPEIIPRVGFDNPELQTTTISPDGSRVVDYYYYRTIYDVSVNVNSNGISNVTGEGQYKFESPITLIVEIETGYAFNGWQVVQGTINPTSGYAYEQIEFILPSSDVEFNVEAYIIPFTITKKFNDNIRADEIINYNYFSDDIVINATTRHGYTFLGWTGEGVTTPQQTITIPHNTMGNMTYVANWEIITYNITYDWKLNSGDTIYAFGTTHRPGLPIANNNAGNPNTYNYEVSTITLQNPTRENYTFNGWIGEGVTTPTINLTLPHNSTENKHYTAVFTVNKVDYTILHITMNTSGNYDENDTSNVSVETHNDDMYISVTPIVRTMTGFTSPSSQTIELSPNPNNNIVKYYYSRNTYKLTFSANNNTGNEYSSGVEMFIVAGNAYNYDNVNNIEVDIYYNSTIDIGFTLTSNVDFYHWDCSETLSNPNSRNLRITVLNDITFVANTVQWFSITYTLNSGILQGTLIDKYTELFDDINVNAVLIKRGYTWHGWDGTDLQSTTKNFVIPHGSKGNRSFVAIFTANSYNITFDKQDGEGGTDGVTATFDSVMPTASAPTRTGYTFKGYFDSTSGGTQYYNDNMTSASLWNKDSDTILYAHWQINTYQIFFTGGIGIDEIFVNTVPTATEDNASSKPSGTYYNFNTTVYVIVKISENTAQYTYSGPTGFTHGTGLYYYKQQYILDNIDVGTINAGRELNRYTITYNSNDGNNSTIVENYYYGDTFTTRASNAFIKNNFTIVNWRIGNTSTELDISHSYTYNYGSDITLNAVWNLVLPVTDTTAKYYSNGSLYNSNSSAYYECSYCHQPITSNSTGCPSHNHNNTTQYYCTSCGTWGTYHAHSTYIGDQYGNVTCGTCGGSGKCQACNGAGVITSISGGAFNAYGCTSCGGSGHYRSDHGATVGSYTRGSGKCSTCGGSGSVWGVTVPGHYEDRYFINGTRTICTNQNCGLTDVNGSGCTHNMSTRMYRYDREYGNGSDTIYVTQTLPTGYYWNNDVGALKNSTTFTFTDSINYSVRTIIDGTAYCVPTGGIIVTLDKQGGDGGDSGVVAYQGNAMPHVTAPSRLGYSFAGYYENANGGGKQYYDASMNSVNNWDKSANTTIYAKWSINSYTVTFTAGFGIQSLFVSTTPDATTGSASGVSYNYGSTIYLIAQIKNNDAQYTYASPTGFTASANSGYYYLQYIIGASNLEIGTIDANYVLNTYTLTYDSNDDLDLTKTYTYAYNENFITLAANAFGKTGYRVASWQVGDTSTMLDVDSVYTFSYDTNITLKAVWELDTITLNVTDTTSLYYYEGSLYSKDDTSLYECQNCHNYVTGNTAGCSEHNHTNITQHHCTYCGNWVNDPNHTHTENYSVSCSTCGGSGNVTCSTCGGTGSYQPYGGRVEGCTACGGSGYKILQQGFSSDRWVDHGFVAGRGWNSCGTCGGSGQVTSQRQTSYIDGTRTYCTTCSAINEASGCLHNCGTNVYRKYTLEYGDGVSEVYSPRISLTGYYWNTIVGALKVDTIFTYSNGNYYKVVSIADGVATCNPTSSSRFVNVLLDENHDSSLNTPFTMQSVNSSDVYGNLPTLDYRIGYDFAGWYTDAYGGTLVTNSTNVISTYDHQLYAHWTAVDYTQLNVEDTTSLYEYNNSLYIKDDTNTNYYECEYCHGYVTDNSLGCTSHSHSNETQYYCTNCGNWVNDSNHTHTVHHNDVYGDVNCGTCNGTGKVWQVCGHCNGAGYVADGIRDWGCNECGGSGYYNRSSHRNNDYVKGAGGWNVDCSTCNGTGKVTGITQYAYDEEVSYITETRTYCDICEQYNVSGSGCKHSIITSTIYKKFIKQYGSGSANIYLTDDFNSTGYYWNINVGALKVGTVFTHTDGYNYIVRGVNDGVVYATRQT